ncbi:MFS transporter [Falsiroseomonas sp. HW251]|uniref:MFS transporter n=1 Tax=Falsiroseomonas sp. HW251 TaxID=3390998 RepID=UPI003D3136F3
MASSSEQSPALAALRPQVGTLIVATSAVQLANGFFNTFISLRVAQERFDPTIAGLVLSAYFAGFTVAALWCGRVIDGIGHIRAYAAFAGLVVVATTTMALVSEPLIWIVQRAVIGFGCAGIFVTTESWLNAKTQPAERGRVFATYMVGTFLALAFGQLLIGPTDITAAAPFNAIAALFAVALVMVSATRAEAPRATAAAGTLPFRQLARAAPVAFAGCVVNGLLSGTFYSLVPAWMQGDGIDRATIALFMLAAVLGGLAFQIPVGWLSDRFDRRVVLAVLGCGFGATAITLVLLPHPIEVLLPGAALLGGFLSTLYPVCVANAHDRMPADRVLAVSRQLILLSGVGSVLGPLIGAGVMGRFDIDGVLYFMAAAAFLLAALALQQNLATAAPAHLERTFVVLGPQAASLAHDPLESNDNAPRSSEVDSAA